jgi:transposase
MNEITQKKYSVYCGIDFHKVDSVLCMLDSEGKPFGGSGVVTIKTAKLTQYLANKKDWLIGIEATGGANHMVAELKKLGLTVVLINPNQFRGIAIGGKKTDKRDATALARALQAGFIPEVYHKSQKAREIKSILTLREQCVNTRCRYMQSIRGTLRELGITMPAGAENFYEQARGKIIDVESVGIKETLMEQLDEVFREKGREKHIEERAKRLVQDDPLFEQLKTIPGVGDMTAMMLFAVVDDISRFKSAKDFASYLGLIPSVSASANRCMMGSITRSGSEMLRRYLIHGARAWMRYDSKGDPNRSWAEQVKERRGMNKATVALAHRIARIAFAVMRDRVEYKVVKLPTHYEDEKIAS